MNAKSATSAPSALSSLQVLPRTPRMPVVFIGHGSPMNVLRDDNPWRPAWEALGAQFGTDHPRPAAILCISAHWLTRGWWITGQAEPSTIHDFGPAYEVLTEVRYPAPGAPGLAQDLAALQPGALQVDPQDWGYDHGNWSVLKFLFPQADIPVLQLSLDYDADPAEHVARGATLRELRERGVLIVGTGNVVHNLRAARRDAPTDQAYDWAIEFDQWVAPLIDRADGATLATFRQLGEVARLAHPTHEHFLPLLHTVGAVGPEDRARQFNTAFEWASVSMRSVVWA